MGIFVNIFKKDNDSKKASQNIISNEYKYENVRRR